MTEEIGRLGLLVNEFDHPFHPHPGFLRTYKKVRTTKTFTVLVIYKCLMHACCSIGAVRSPGERPGKEYDSTLL